MFRRHPHRPSRAAEPSTSRALVAGGALLMLAAASVEAANSGSATVTSDYVWRGTSQSQGDPAVQAGFRASAASSWYGSIWASGVEFAPETQASSEFDFVAGWSGNLAPDWALDVGLTHYHYPSTTVDLDWTEAVGTLTWRQDHWLQVGHSSDALATGGAGTYVQVGARLPLHAHVRIEGAIGHYWLEDAYGDRYAHAQLGTVWNFASPLELRVTLHDTDSNARRLFPGLAGSRLEAALQASF